MMMRTVGGPGLVSPIDFGERRKLLPRSTWIAIGVVALAHVGVGTALYHQRFEPESAPPAPTDRTIDVEFRRLPPPPPPEPVVSSEPPAPNPRLNDTPLPVTPTETLPAVVIDTPTTGAGPVITLATPVSPTEPVGAVTEPAQPPRGPAVIRSPQWVARPSGAQLMRAYPARAMAAGVTGSASLRCLVGIDGTLSNCTVISETPGNQGFGRAAVGLGRYFRMSPRTVDGQAVDGAAVDVAIRFTMAD